MTDFAPLLQPDRGESAHTLRLVDAKTFDGWLKAQPQRVAAAVAAQRFAGKGYELAILPGDKDADDWSVVLGVANVGELSPWRSEEHTSELQSLMRISYAVFCLKKQNKHKLC